MRERDGTDHPETPPGRDRRRCFISALPVMSGGAWVLTAVRRWAERKAASTAGGFDFRCEMDIFTTCRPGARWAGAAVGRVVHDTAFYAQRPGHLGHRELAGGGWRGSRPPRDSAAGGKVGAPGLLDLGREGDAPAVVEAFLAGEQATGDPKPVTVLMVTPRQRATSPVLSSPGPSTEVRPACGSDVGTTPLLASKARP